MKRIGRSFRALALGLAVLGLAGCGSRAQEKAQKQIFSMDTVMLLTCYGPHADEALTDAAERITALDETLDPELEGSAVHAVNAGAGGWTEVPEDVLQILSTSRQVWEETGGALDVGLYPVIKAWGFIDQDYRVPTDEELSALLAVKDTGGIELDAENSRVWLPAGMEISLGAVAKGFAGAAAVQTMADAGADCAIVSLGGNVQTLGQTKPDGSAWQVAVTDPRDTGSYVGVLAVGQTAVVTSGGYQRYFEQDGVTYIHILDPETGRPVDNGLLSVTVVCEDGTRADALSTALFVLGEEGALAYAAAHSDIGLVLVTDDGRVVVTKDLAASFTENSQDYVYEYGND